MICFTFCTGSTLKEHLRFSRLFHQLEHVLLGAHLLQQEIFKDPNVVTLLDVQRDLFQLFIQSVTFQIE